MKRQPLRNKRPDGSLCGLCRGVSPALLGTWAVETLMLVVPVTHWWQRAWAGRAYQVLCHPPRCSVRFPASVSLQTEAC